MFLPDTILAVRTYSSTTFLEAATDPAESALTSVCELGSIAKRQTGDRPTVDSLVLNNGPTRSLLVNDKGVVYNHSLETCTVSE